MRTLVISDLHLGLRNHAEVLTRPGPSASPIARSTGSATASASRVGP
jgi:metallophosphoesterase superfamily enzyme